MAENSLQKGSEDLESHDVDGFVSDDEVVGDGGFPRVWEVSPGVYYVGDFVLNADSKPYRQGSGTQIVVDEDGEESVRYQGEWNGDKPNGKGVLIMGPEEYRGEFYQGEPNGMQSNFMNRPRNIQV